MRFVCKVVSMLRMRAFLSALVFGMAFSAHAGTVDLGGGALSVANADKVFFPAKINETNLRAIHAGCVAASKMEGSDKSIQNSAFCFEAAVSLLLEGTPITEIIETMCAQAMGGLTGDGWERACLAAAEMPSETGTVQ